MFLKTINIKGMIQVYIYELPKQDYLGLKGFFRILKCKAMQHIC